MATKRCQFSLFGFACISVLVCRGEDGCTVKKTLSYGVTSLSCQYLLATIYSLASVMLLRIIQKFYSFFPVAWHHPSTLKWSLQLMLLYTQLLSRSPCIHSLTQIFTLIFKIFSKMCRLFPACFPKLLQHFPKKMMLQIVSFLSLPALSMHTDFFFCLHRKPQLLWFLPTLSFLITCPTMLEMYKFITFPKNYPVCIYFHSFCVFTQFSDPFVD